MFSFRQLNETCLSYTPKSWNYMFVISKGDPLQRRNNTISVQDNWSIFPEEIGFVWEANTP